MNMTKKNNIQNQREELSSIVSLGDKALKMDYHTDSKGLNYISGSIYDSWLAQIRIFATRHLEDHPLYNKLLESVDNEHSFPNRARRIQEYLKVIENDEEYWQQKYKKSSSSNNPGNANNCTIESGSNMDRSGLPCKIFISHNSKDEKYAIALVNFFKAIGVKKNQMVCTSVPGCGVPLGEDIYDWLEKQFNEYRLHVLFLLSDRYYDSSASLNEMGATWVLRQKYDTIMLPGFEFKKIDGAVDPSQIAIVLDGNDRTLKYRLQELRDEISKELGIEPLDEIDWEDARDTFIEEIKNIPIPKADDSEYEGNKSTLAVGVDNVGNIPADSALLLVYAAEEDSPIILSQDLSSYPTVTTNKNQFMVNNTKRESARWQEALARLVEWGWVKDSNGKGQIYELTGTGYNKADYLKEGMDIDVSKDPREEIKEYE